MNKYGITPCKHKLFCCPWQCSGGVNNIVLIRFEGGTQCTREGTTLRWK